MNKPITDKTINNNPLSLASGEHFRAGQDNLAACSKRLCKLKSLTVLFCRQGKAHLLIDLKEYNITVNTIIFLMPNSIICLKKASKDFDLSYFVCLSDIFHDTTVRMEPRFFHYLKEKPCLVIPAGHTIGVYLFMRSAAVLYADKENRFQDAIARNLLENCLLDAYDKNYRFFYQKEPESFSRQHELFQKFILLAHHYCQQQREVSFYADSLCISAKYLTDICRKITGEPAKKIIGHLAILEIKVLLETSTLSLQAIAEQLNFPDQSYLGRFFKRNEGLSPAEYRNRFN